MNANETASLARARQLTSRRNALPRLLCSVAAACLACAALAACGGSSSLPGTYTAEVTSRIPAFEGPWTLTLKKGGSYTIENVPNGASFPLGKGSYYTSSALVITTREAGSCGPGIVTGTYKLKHTGNTVKLTLVSDPCSLRPLVLLHSFTKVH
jgi:hypothetical protein